MSNNEYETECEEVRVWTDIQASIAIRKIKDQRFRDGWLLVDTDNGYGLPWIGDTILRGSQVVKLYFRRRKQY